MKNILLKLLLFLFTAGIYAQSGEIDRTFNARLGAGANAVVNDVVEQTDGKILMVGNFTNYAYASRNRIARLNTDGSIDTSFNLGIGANNSIVSIVLQPDGKILIIGEFTSYNGISINRIARLNADGTLDTTFSPGTGSNFYTSLSVQTDGKIVIAGFFTTYNGIARNNIARLNQDGSLDTSFDPGTGPNTTVLNIALESTGKIVIIGDFSSFNTISRNRIARLNTNGTLDTTFNPGNGPNFGVSSLAIQTDGKILIGGFFTTYNFVSRNCIVRLNNDGTIDTTFDSAIGASADVQSIAIQLDGKIVLVGAFTTYNNIARNRIVRINNDGTIDNTFSPGIGANNIIRRLELQSSGNILIVGNFTSYDTSFVGRIAQVNANGTFSTTFLNPGAFAAGATNSILTMALQPDGKILAAGAFVSYNGISRIGYIRLNADGTLELPFNPLTTPPSLGGAVEHCIKIQNDGKFLLAGRHTNESGTVITAYLGRWNSDGLVDDSFILGTAGGANSDIVTVAIQSDGKILTGGFFTSHNEISRNRIARLNSNGTLDNTFDPGTAANNAVRAIVVQPDGKILIAGQFTFYNGVSRNRIARINTDGSLDTSFNVGTGANSDVNAIFLQPDGKILIGGRFSSYNNFLRNSLVRINSDGTLDTTFIVGTEADKIVQTIKVHSDGKIVIGGTFTTYNNIARNRIAQLNSDGTIDLSFNPGIGANDDVRDIIIQPDGNILISGLFTSYNSNPVGAIARILNENTTLKSTDFNKKSFTVYPNPSNGIFTIQTDNTLVNATISVADLNGRIVFETKSKNVNNQILDISNLQNGVYILNISNGNSKYSQKLVKQ